MKFKGTGFWHFLYIVDEICEALIGLVEDILDDIGDRLSNVFDSFIDLVKGILFTIIAFPIGLIGAFAHRLKKFFNQEKALKKNWGAFCEWYKENNKEEQ